MERSIPNFPETVFLTGATGVLGGRLLLEILNTTRAKVYCLVRARDSEMARARLDAILSVYDSGRYFVNALRARVVPVLGDITDPDLGVSSETYRELQQEIELVIHAAASVNLIASYDELEPINVQGTRHVANLSLASGAPFVYVSSYSVLGDKMYERDFVFKETDFEVDQNFFEGMRYEQSKFEAERVVRGMGAKGLRWSIVRPGNIFGDSETGCYPLRGTTETGIYYDILRTVVETGFSFDYAQCFDVTPVDYVAKAIVRLSTQTHTGQTYHLTNPASPSFNDLVGALRACGYTVRTLALDDYLWALAESRLVRAGRPYTSNFTKMMAFFVGEEDLVEYARFDTAQAAALLDGTDIRCARVDERLVRRYVDYCVRCGHVPTSTQQQQLLAEILPAA